MTFNGGTEILSGTGNYTGTTTINSGATLSLTSLNSLISSPIVVNGTGSTAGTLDISQRDQQSQQHRLGECQLGRPARAM